MKQPESKQRKMSRAGLSPKLLKDLATLSKGPSLDKFKPGSAEWYQEKEEWWLDRLMSGPLDLKKVPPKLAKALKEME